MDLSECDLKKIKNLDLLRGRRRLVARVIEEIVSEEDVNKTKQECLEAAINTSIMAHRNSMITRFRYALQNLNQRDFILLRKLYTAVSLFNGRVDFLLEGESPDKYLPDEAGQLGSDMDLVEIGLASLLYSKEEKWVKVNEPLVAEVLAEVLPQVAALQDFIQEYKQAIQLTTKDAIKGSPFEKIVHASLLVLFKACQEQLSVADFARKFMPPESNLPRWASDAKLRISALNTPDELKLKSETDYATKIAENQTLDGVLLYKVSNYMRPDALQLNVTSATEGGKKNMWALVISTKLYSNPVPSNTVESDFTSTDISSFYTSKKKGREGEVTSKIKHEAWTSAINKLNHMGSLRVHVLLPRTATVMMFLFLNP